MNIRNFCVIAHIDHGKSTLADRFLELTGVIKVGSGQQILDSNPIEKERGVTIKLAAVRMEYLSDTQTYILNLIDTPGHTDFGYEVNRSLAVCEGALLLVDATQGIQAQTLVNYQKAKNLNLRIIPVINKIDLESAETEKVLLELNQAFGFSLPEVSLISAKTGEGVNFLIERIIKEIPPPQENLGETRGIIFDSFYDTYRGVVTLVKIVDGEIRKGEKIKFLSAGQVTNVLDIGYLELKFRSATSLRSGEVGFIVTDLRDIEKARSGDTITLENKSVTPLPGYVEPKPVVFAAIYPLINDEYLKLREAILKLKLNDASLQIQPISSSSLGNGYLCGFLGTFHAEITSERLKREFGLEVLVTSPSVEYEIRLGDKRQLIRNISELPDFYDEIYEPWVDLTVLTPGKYLGQVLELLSKESGEHKSLEYLGDLVKLNYQMPLLNVISGLFNKLKSVTSGFGSLEYELTENRLTNVVRLDIFLNKEKVEAFSRIVRKGEVEREGRILVEKLKEAIPRQQFAVPIQAAVGAKIVARADVPAFRKDVTAKLYGGDRTRKDKLLEAQKKGKKRMRSFGKIEIPQEVFWKVI